MLIDRALVDRLERTAGRLDALAADVLAASGAPAASPAVPWGAGLLVAFGPGRYVNRLCGLGTSEVDVDDAARIETFFADRGVPSCIDVTPWASPSLLRLLAERGYTPTAFRNVYVRPVTAPTHEPPLHIDATVSHVGPGGRDHWIEVMSAAFGGLAGQARTTSDEYCRTRFAMPAGRNFIASIDGAPAGCGSLELEHGVAWLGGMATIPEHRGRGVQAALIRHRLEVAVELGADLVASTAVPDGASARNLLRHGFQLAYSRLEATR